MLDKFYFSLKEAEKYLSFLKILERIYCKSKTGLMNDLIPSY
jgi:hypothetical protein